MDELSVPFLPEFPFRPFGQHQYTTRLLWLGFAVSCAPVYLITWRVARRFGRRALAVCALAAAVIGPPRDYRLAAMYPDWIAYSPGIAPVLAVATI